VDLLGYYEMGPNGKKKIDLEKYNKWVKSGAQPSATVQGLVK